MLAVGGLSVLAGAVGVPYPIVLVLGGLVLGFVPGMPPAELPPELVLVLFLPPLLFQEAFSFSPRELRANAPRDRPAGGRAGAGDHDRRRRGRARAGAWAAVGGRVRAGAIVSPTDRWPLPPSSGGWALRRMVTVLEGESLVNDATALVAYRLAVAAVVAGASRCGRPSCSS